MNASLRSSLLLAVPALLALAPAARAQDDMVPRELALALFSSGDFDRLGVEMLVGRVPESVPPELLHPGAHLVGSITFGHNGLIVARAAQAPAEVLAAAEARLTAAGWRRFERPGDWASFSSAPAGTPEPVQFCNAAGNAVMVVSMPRAGGGSDLRLMFDSEPGSSACSKRRHEEQFGSEIDLPRLEPPGGSRMAGASGNGSNGTDYHMLYLVEGDAGPEVLLPHYAEQLRHKGWKLGQRTLSALVAAQEVETRGVDGHRWTGLLIAYALPSGLHEVSLRVSRVDAP